MGIYNEYEYEELENEIEEELEYEEFENEIEEELEDGELGEELFEDELGEIVKNYLECDTKVNKYIKQFMEDNNLKVNEEFIISLKCFNPYKFDEDGYLLDRDGSRRNELVGDLLMSKLHIKHKK